MAPWQTAQVNPFAHIRECSRPHSCCLSAHSLHFGQWCGVLPVFYLHNSTIPRSLSSMCGSMTFSSKGQRDFERYGAIRVGTHAPAAIACSAAAQGRDSAYLRFKSRLLNTLELTVPQTAPGILINGSRWLDVGAGSGEIANYLSHKYGVRITVYDVAPPASNKWATDRRGALGAAQRLGFPVTVFGSMASGCRPRRVDRRTLYSSTWCCTTRRIRHRRSCARRHVFHSAGSLCSRIAT